MFIHMPRDDDAAFLILDSLKYIRESPKRPPFSVALTCLPLPVTNDFFARRQVSWVPINQSMSEQLVADLRSAGKLESSGLIREDPRGSDWREAVRRTARLVGDDLVGDSSPIAELMNRAYARHEACGTHAAEAMRFCLRPRETCSEMGWDCGH
eukprot:c17900_g1_i1.p2 GENE.c17900_g1_i1~~c17900_g1_i1.p2  ORF type:complete len:154 (+),score=30.78 c17900_g1_i1:859-1320(+)